MSWTKSRLTALGLLVAFRANCSKVPFLAARSGVTGILYVMRPNLPLVDSRTLLSSLQLGSTLTFALAKPAREQSSVAVC